VRVLPHLSGALLLHLRDSLVGPRAETSVVDGAGGGGAVRRGRVVVLRRHRSRARRKKTPKPTWRISSSPTPRP
jgi:hypothetical protein